MLGSLYMQVSRRKNLTVCTPFRDLDLHLDALCSINSSYPYDENTREPLDTAIFILKSIIVRPPIIIVQHSHHLVESCHLRLNKIIHGLVRQVQDCEIVGGIQVCVDASTWSR